MAIVPQSPLFLSTSLPAAPVFPLLAAPPKRLALPAPKIVGYLSATAGVTQSELRSAMSPLQHLSSVSAGVSIAPPDLRKPEKAEKRVVEAEIANPLRLIDDPREKWTAFERIYGRDRSREEMDAELDAIIPGYTAFMRTRMQQINPGKHVTKEKEAAS